jgi:dethiobiotin synthetase
LSALPGLFVVGTDTGVGKTRVASTIARCLVQEGRRVGVLKPVATGVPGGAGRGGGEDADWLIAAAGGSIAPERVVPLAFEAPLAPVVAARLLGRRLERAEVERALDAALAWWADRADIMVVEGIGGLLTPLAEGTTVADLAIRLDYPLVVVARRALGTLNHTLLTTEAALRRGLRIAGLVLNSASCAGDAAAELAEETAAAELARRLDGVAILGEVPFMGGSGTAEVEAILGGIDWAGRALRPRYVPAAIVADVAGEEIEQP